MKKIIVKYKNLIVHTIVDDEYYDQLNKYSWHLAGTGYARRGTTIRENGVKKSVCYSMHRVIMNAMDGQIVDHIDGNKLNNQKENLRFVTREQSNQNRKVSSLSGTGYKGVSLKSDHHKRTAPYEVKIAVGKKKIWIGNYETAMEAALHYDEAALIYHGEYAKLNFPEDNWREILK